MLQHALAGLVKRRAPGVRLGKLPRTRVQRRAHPFSKVFHVSKRLQGSRVIAPQRDEITPAADRDRKTAIQPTIPFNPRLAPVSLVMETIAIIDAEMQRFLQRMSADSPIWFGVLG